MLEVSCPCGKCIPVSAGQAGSSVECQCGREVPIPSLRQLRQSAESEGRSTRPIRVGVDWSLWWKGVVILIAGEVTSILGMVCIMGVGPWDTQFTRITGVLLCALGAIASFIGVFAIARGKGFAMWFCFLLFFCLPFGRLVMIFIPGKSDD